jgi:hypothetical protein
MLSKEEELKMSPGLDFSVPLTPIGGLRYNPIPSYKSGFQAKELEEEKKVPEWEFQECCEELITFTEVSQKRFPLIGKHTNDFVIHRRNNRK